MKFTFAFAFLMALTSISARVYFEETFSEPDSIDRWIKSTNRDDYGELEISPGIFYADEEKAKGLQLKSDARFYAYSAKLDRNFNTKGKDFILQYTVKYEQSIDCGGAYLKLLPPHFEPELFNGDTEYNIMFGPDICGETNRRVHAILNYNDKNVQINKEVSPRSDQLTHQFTFWIKKDKTFEIRVDNKVSVNGTLAEFWDVLPPKEIPDESIQKPEDWEEEESVVDPEDVKPEDWEEGEPKIPDPDAQVPEDWDEEMDGDFAAPLIDNPDYKGPWKPKMIANPDYKGEWVQPMIPNPDYEEDEDFGVFNIGYIGLDVWTVKSGTIIDNILITDDNDYAVKFGDETWSSIVGSEIQALDLHDKAEKEKYHLQMELNEQKNAAKGKVDIAEKEGEDEEKEEKVQDNLDDLSDDSDDDSSDDSSDDLDDFLEENIDDDYIINEPEAKDDEFSVDFDDEDIIKLRAPPKREEL